MAYVAARGGERAIAHATALFRARLGPIDRDRVAEVERSLPFLIDRVMGEASLYAPELAALALAQSGGDLAESVLLLRAYRTTLPRIGYAEPVPLSETRTLRRVSAAFKDIPGGQILGPTLDYAHRVLNTSCLDGDKTPPPAAIRAGHPAPERLPSVTTWQRRAGLVPKGDAPDPARGRDIPDLTREPLLFPPSRAHTLQSLARADTGGAMSLGYSAMRGYGAAHPVVNEVRLAEADLLLRHPSGPIFSAGRVRVSQAEVVTKNASGTAPLSLGTCATLGWNEIKTIAGAALDLAMRGSDPHPAHSPDFVLHHTEAVDASGFCLHFKLPHYVTFQSALDARRAAAQEPGGLPESAPKGARSAEQALEVDE